MAQGLTLNLDPPRPKKRKQIPFTQFLKHCKIENTQTYEIVPFELWPYLMESATRWGKGESDTILKARQLGFTWLAVCYAYWVIRKPNSRVLVISHGQEYSKAFIDRMRIVHENLPEGLRKPIKKDNSEEFSLVGGGTAKALPSTEDAGRSFQASVVIVDEAAFHAYAEKNYRAYRPTVADGGQLIVMSTANGITNWFASRFRAANAQGKATFIPWHARPGRDEAWYENERNEWLMGENLDNEGRDFLQEYPASPDEAFHADEGTVFKMFDREKHVIDRPPVEWEDCQWRVMGLDFGGEDPSAAVAIGIARVPYVKQDDKDHGWRLYVYDEFYSNKDVTVRDVALWMKTWHDRAPISAIEVGEAKKSPIVMEMRQYFPRVNVEGAKGNPEVRINYHKHVLERGMLQIAAHCTNIFREYASYKRRLVLDPNSRTQYVAKTPVDHHGDAMDAMGYAITYIMRSVRSGKQGKKTLKYHQQYAGKKSNDSHWPWNVIRDRRKAS